MSDRADDLDAYVLNARACLRETPEGFGFDESLEAQFAEQINKSRKKHGIPALIYRPELRQAARWHSLDMAANKFFDHRGPDATTAKDRIHVLDPTLLTGLLLENIASIRGDFDPDKVVTRLHSGLMKSPSHRDAILEEGVTHFAVGVVATKRGVWLTELFVREDAALDRRPAAVHLDTADS